MPNYTTGEVAKLCNVSVRTVQYYDTKGILHPSDLTEGGRRLYSDDDLRKFQLVCTLKAIGLSLGSIKSILESELSAKILTMLLDEHEKLLTEEIGERQKQLAMVGVIKKSIGGQATVPANTIIGIDDIMEKKKVAEGKKKHAILYAGIGAVSVLGLLFMGWLVVSGHWWGLAFFVSVAAIINFVTHVQMKDGKKKLVLIYAGVGVVSLMGLVFMAWLVLTGNWLALAAYGAMAAISLLISGLQMKDAIFTCPKCDSDFTQPLSKIITSTGSHKARWMSCPGCGHKDWCVLRESGRSIAP